jgi:hypothetical protein
MQGKSVKHFMVDPRVTPGTVGIEPLPREVASARGLLDTAGKRLAFELGKYLEVRFHKVDWVDMVSADPHDTGFAVGFSGSATDPRKTLFGVPVTEHPDDLPTIRLEFLDYARRRDVEALGPLTEQRSRQYRDQAIGDVFTCHKCGGHVKAKEPESRSDHWSGTCRACQETTFYSQELASLAIANRQAELFRQAEPELYDELRMVEESDNSTQAMLALVMHKLQTPRLDA